MGATILLFIKKIKLTHILIVAIIGLVVGLNYYRNTAIEEVHKKELALNNFNNELKLDSLQVAHYKVQKSSEIATIINQKEEFKNLYKQTKIKASRLETAILQQNKYQDTTHTEFDFSKMLDSIMANKPVTQLWESKDSCSTIKGTMAFNNGKLSNTITHKEFNDETATFFYKGKRKPVKWLFNIRLGKRQDTIVTVGKCTKPKIQIIEKVK